jgi:hypothetical protein
VTKKEAEDIARERRMGFVKRRQSKIPQSAEVPASRSAAPATKMSTAQREAFWSRRRLLITKPLPVDGPEVYELATAGARLEKELIKALAKPFERNRLVTQPHEAALSFLVGAREVGLDNVRYDFPSGCELIKQGANEVTIASADLRVTLHRTAATADIPRQWRVINVIKPTSERTGTTTVRASRNRSTTHTLRH